MSQFLGLYPNLSHRAPLARREHALPWPGKTANAVRKGVPPFASISVHSRLSPSPSPMPKGVAPQARVARFSAPPTGTLPVAPPGHPRFAPQARGCAIRNVATANVSPCFSTSLPCHRPLPEHQRCSAPKPGVARFSALPRVRIGKPQQPQRGCAEAPNVWSGPHRLGLHSCN